MQLTIDLAVLLTVVIVLLVRRPVQPRKRTDQWTVVAIVVAFGVLVAPTGFGQWVLSVVQESIEVIGQIQP